MSNEHQSSGSADALMPALALGGAGLGAYGLHRAGLFRGLGRAAATEAEPSVAAAMKNSMKPAGTAAAAAHTPVSTATNTQAGAADAQRSLGLKMDPAVEASMVGKQAPVPVPAVENLGGLSVDTADLGRPGARAKKPRGAKTAPAPTPTAPVPAAPLIGSNMITRM